MVDKQKFLDQARSFNKHFTNKLTILIAGKRFGHFVVLTHQGRKSGRLYKTPVIAEPVADGFIIALTYGRKVDWCANVLAAGHCSLFWKNKEYALDHPHFVDRELGIKAFPWFFQRVLRAMKVGNFLQLDMVSR